MKILLIILLASCSKPSDPFIAIDEVQEVLSWPRNSTDTMSVGDAWTIVSDEKIEGFFVGLPSGGPFPFKHYEGEFGHTYSWFPSEDGVYRIAYIERDLDGSINPTRSYWFTIVVRYEVRLPELLTKRHPKR